MSEANMKELQMQMAALQQRLQALEDREAIRQLIARYGPAVDSQRLQDAAAIWAEDGRYSVAGFGTHQGRAALTALLQAPHHQQLLADGCAHVLSPLHIQLDGDEAVAVGYSCVFRHQAETGHYVAERVAANRWLLQKQGGQWQVSLRENALLDGSAAAHAVLEIARP